MHANYERFGAICDRTLVSLTEILACVSAKISIMSPATTPASKVSKWRDTELAADLGHSRDAYLVISSAMVTQTLVKRPRDLYSRFFVCSGTS